MAEMKWTEGQRLAIDTDGGDLLVSAAAGSGKTAVLTERAVRLMTGDPPMDADRLLIATFTNAAAGEMRRRIRARLAARMAEQPDDPLLRRQMRLLDGAQIGTVHAFCQRLLRQHFERLDIQPNFRLLGEEESRLLRAEVAERVVYEAYGGDDPAFPELVELLGTTRSDQKVVDTVLGVYQFVSAHPFYHHWMDEKLALYSRAGGAADSVWGQALVSYARSALDYCLEASERLADDCLGDAALEKSYLPAIYADQSLFMHLSEVIEGGDWDKMADAFAAATFARMGSIRGEHPTKEAVKAARDNLKDILKKLKESFTVREADFRADIADLLPKITCLFGLVKRFDADYAALKRARGTLDFTDLEQMAIELLIDRQPDGSYVPTDIALEVQGRFDAIMVDEYQDINAVQDAIFRAVSKGDNLFMVGDVKQSIYRFRQASPELFIRKMDSFCPVGQGFPALIRLSNNFRSRREVTDAVNAVFTLLMSREVGEMDYTPAEHLVPVEGPPMPSAGAELILIDSGAADEEESALELEADYVARHIRALLDSGAPVREGDTTRPVQPGDIALLLSAPRTSALAFIRALERVGITSTSAQRPEFLGAYEVAPVVGLLKAIDNPLREVELTSALLSPLFGLTPDHLAHLRTGWPGESLISALRAARGEGEPFASAYALFEALRHRARLLPTHELITEIYEQTGYEVAVGMMADGTRRLGNLHLLVDYAAGQADRGYHTLSDFVTYLDQLAGRGQDLTAAAAGENSGVAVLSIHQSKGLEYPVVYLCHLGKQINRMDLRERTIIHPEYGFACVRRDPALHIQYDSLPYTAVKLESERALMSEELRKLYVAMTRARDRLIMTCTCKDPTARLDALHIPLTGEGRLPAYRVRSAASMADWLMLCAAHTQEDARFAPIDVHIVEGFDRSCAIVGGETAQEEASAEADPALVAGWTDRLNFIYPHAGAVKVPAKLSVSQLTKTDVTARFLRRPGFMSPEGLAPTERGNAVHLFMQLCDYHRAAADPAAEALRLYERGLMSEAQYKAVDTARIRAFFEGETGRRVLASDRVLREFEFVAPAGPDIVNRYMPGLVMGEEPMMIQGIADCIFFEGQRAILLDYKTDYTTDADALVLRYAPQLSVYRDLLPAFLEADIAESYIYAFRLGRAIPV